MKRARGSRNVETPLVNATFNKGSQIINCNEFFKHFVDILVLLVTWLILLTILLLFFLGMNSNRKKNNKYQANQAVRLPGTDTKERYIEVVEDNYIAGRNVYYLINNESLIHSHYSVGNNTIVSICRNVVCFCTLYTYTTVIYIYVHIILLRIHFIALCTIFIQFCGSGRERSLCFFSCFVNIVGVYLQVYAYSTKIVCMSLDSLCCKLYKIYK